MINLYKVFFSHCSIYILNDRQEFILAKYFRHKCLSPFAFFFYHSIGESNYQTMVAASWAILVYVAFIKPKVCVFLCYRKRKTKQTVLKTVNLCQWSSLCVNKTGLDNKKNTSNKRNFLKVCWFKVFLKLLYNVFI